MFYAGIGSRQTPRNILSLMTKCANRLRELGYTLRSGGAQGADTAFELGAGLAKEIYLPWRNFNNHRSHLHDIDPLAREMARKFHPAWDRCSPAAQKFHARNCYQVLGYSLASPSDFVLCWTPGGQVTGGTGQALRIAQHYEVPIVNMFHDTWREQMVELLDHLQDERAGAYEQQCEQEQEAYLTRNFNECGTPMF